MLVTFSSKAGSNILMLAPHAKPLLKIIGKVDDKDLLTRGVVMPEHLQDAISRLKQAITVEPKQEDQEENDAFEESKNPRVVPVGLRQRAFPLLDLLERANTMRVPVMWESGSGW